MYGFGFGRVFVVLLAIGLAAPVAVADTPTQPPIAFMGKSYDLYKREKIHLGWALYFAPDHQDPDRADQSIVVDYFDAADDKGNPISAEGVARAMATQDKAKGAVLLPPFATPDPANPGKYNFFVQLYYIYPQDRNGDIWVSKVSQVNGAVVGILYKQRVAGADAGAISDAVRNWLLVNLRTYGTALSALAPPPAGK
jgi:hypothetical protein